MHEVQHEDVDEFCRNAGCEEKNHHKNRAARAGTTRIENTESLVSSNGIVSNSQSSCKTRKEEALSSRQELGILCISSHIPNISKSSMTSMFAQSWQAIRQKALKAISMMDHANSKWNRALVDDALAEWAEFVRWERI
eukprot:761413-Hanusia_phi.AAC.1